MRKVGVRAMRIKCSDTVRSNDQYQPGSSHGFRGTCCQKSRRRRMLTPDSEEASLSPEPPMMLRSSRVSYHAHDQIESNQIKSNGGAGCPGLCRGLELIKLQGGSREAR